MLDYQVSRATPSVSSRPNFCALGDACPRCNLADLVRMGQKDVCPGCGYIQPCCQP